MMRWTGTRVSGWIAASAAAIAGLPLATQGDESPAADPWGPLALLEVLREFNVEGYVLEYDCEVADKRVICTSVRIESGAGMRARVTLTIEDGYRFVEDFELAGPGENLAHYLTVRWMRVPDLAD
jgi:hypothetical protein